VAEADHVVLSTRIAGLILLLYGTPVRKIYWAHYLRVLNDSKTR
jgi:hypothetical protein